MLGLETWAPDLVQAQVAAGQVAPEVEAGEEGMAALQVCRAGVVVRGVRQEYLRPRLSWLIVAGGRRYTAACAQGPFAVLSAPFPGAMPLTQVAEASSPADVPSAADIVNAVGPGAAYKVATTLWARAMVEKDPAARAVLSTRMWLPRSR